MAMNAPTKFLFDVDFAGGASRKPAMSLAEHAQKLAEAEAAGHRRGYAEAQADAKAEAERRIAGALERIASGIAEATKALTAIETRLECEAVEVAVAVARKLAPALIAREPFAEIAALASDCFGQFAAAPHIAVRIHDTLYATARDKLEAIVRARGFEGRLVVLAEPEIAPGDCRIEWADGGVNRDSAGVEAAIGAAVTAYVSARRVPAAPAAAAAATATADAQRYVEEIAR
jgi:flagellar assembly protein FliH